MRSLDDSLNMLVMACMSDWYRGIREKTHHDDIDRIVRESGFANRMEWRDDGRADHMWCGMYAACHAGTVGMPRILRPGMFHVKNVEDFFNYRYGKRVPRWVKLPMDGGDTMKMELHGWHEDHDAMRRWITHEDIDAMVDEDGAHMVGFADQGLIMGGDILLVDNKADGTPNHITVVRNYSGGVITTVEGNAGGIVFVKREGGGGGGMETESVRGDAVAINHRDLSKSKHRARIYGIGRFSPLDFDPTQEYERG